ncbi:hypothetical protein AB0M96_30260, partial [Streptomyces sp. NPDC051098]
VRNRGRTPPSRRALPGGTRRAVRPARCRSRAFAAGVDEIRQNVATGRVALLAVEENYRETVRDTGEHLNPAEPGDLDALDDIVDDIVERSLDTGAEVRFVPDGALADVGGIASALRY